MKAVTDAVRMEIREPRLMSSLAVLVACSYGLLLFIPVVLVLLVVSVLPFGWMTLVFPLTVFGAATALLPFGAGNTLIKKLARDIPLPSTPSPKFLVQLTFVPRLRSGPRALIEDADDVGWLVFLEESMEFYGDSIRLAMTYDSIESARPGSIGLRGLYLYPALQLRVSRGESGMHFSIAERSSWLLSGARRITREIQRQLSVHRPSA
jgi:hypothetical protein